MNAQLFRFENKHRFRGNMAGGMDYEKRLQLDVKVDSIFSKLSTRDSEAWRAAKRNSDRIEIVFRNADIFHREMMVTDERNLGNKNVWGRAHKSASEAEELRRQGNEQFAKGKYLKAIERYSAAIVRAPVDDVDLLSIFRGCSSVSQLSTEDTVENNKVRLSGDSCSNENMMHNGLKECGSNLKSDSIEGSSSSKNGSKELALALANRSAALFHLKRCEEAIRDIDYSLRFGYPRETRYKLYERRARAWLQLGRRREADRDAGDAGRHLRETMPDSPVRQKHLDSLDALRRKCRESGGTLEVEEWHEVGEKRKVGEMDQKDGQQKGPDMKHQAGKGYRNDRDLRQEDDSFKRFKERDVNDSKENACIQCKRIGDGCSCWREANSSQDRPNFFSSSGGHPWSGFETNRVPPESDFGSFFAGIDICHSELCGRYTVSKQNLQVGKVIASTIPFAAVLFPDCHSTHCYHCFREVSIPFPCYMCSQVVYCDYRCSVDAWNVYHWAECGWMRWMTFDLVGRLGHLAYRMLVTGGLANVLKVFMGTSTRDQEKIDSMEDSGNSETGSQSTGSRETSDSAGKCAAVGSLSEAPRISGASPEPNHNPCSRGGVSCRTAHYAQLMTELVRHESTRIPSDDLWFCAIAFFLLQISKRTGWLSTGTGRTQATEANTSPPDSRLDEEETEKEKAVFAALLHHIQAIQCNAFEITEMRPIDEGGQTRNVLSRHKIHGIGMGLYSELTMVNHSCDPTVDVVFYGNRAIVRAIRNIRTSDEVTVDYGQLFFLQDKSMRQSFLRSTYFFDCCCQPCVENWPLWKDLPAFEPSIKCPGCGAPLKAVSVSECSKCRRVFGDELTKAVVRLDDRRREYVEAMRRMDSVKKSPEAEESEMKRVVTVVEDYLSTMQELLCPPWREFYSTQATLRQCYRLMANISSQAASG